MPAAGFAMVAFRLGNAAHLAAAFGEEAAKCALDHVQSMLGAVVGDLGVVAPVTEDVVTALIWDSRLVGQIMSEASCERFVWRFAAKVTKTAVPFGGQDVRVSIAGNWSLLNAEQSDDDFAVAGADLLARLGAARFDGAAPGVTPDWAARYRADMAQASWLFSAMASRRLLLAWQSVRSGEDYDAVLYHECLLRVLDGGHQKSAGPAIAALERLGLVDVIDQYVVTRVIEELRRDPDVCLGVNISAHSARPGGWWVDFEDQLRKQPDVARRLVVEITETASFPDIGQASIFTCRLRKLGVRIALDDFGVGHASLRSLLAIQPDIIKIDAFFMRLAAGSDRGRKGLAHLIGLAASFVPDVIVEGVEPASDSELVRAAGAAWQQGYHIGYPSVVRPWSHDLTGANVLAMFEYAQSKSASPRKALG